jgi:uncharacterized protein
MSKSQQQPWTTTKKHQLASGQAGIRKAGERPGSVRWAGLARWLHLYLSVVSFVLVLFFAVTGLTLNHAEWFDGDAVTTDTKGKLNPAWVAGTDTGTVNKLAIVEYLRATYNLKGTVSEFRSDDRQCSVSFRSPGYSADAFVERPGGTYELNETRMGLVAILNDLHKGRDTGRGWAWVIDVSAVFMTLVSVTGLLLLLVLKKRRVSGLWWVLIGGILSALAWWGLVP